MSLTTRLSVFFLAALALVLGGFSGAVYLVETFSLHRQIAERLESALRTLAAAAEIGPDGIEWERKDRVIELTPSGSTDSLRWAVVDDQGQILDASHHQLANELLARPDLEHTAVRPIEALDGQGHPWKLMQRRMHSSASQKAPPAAQPNPAEVGQREGKYPMLVLSAGMPLDGLNASLRRLAVALTGLSAGAWVDGCAVERLSLSAIWPAPRER